MCFEKNKKLILLLIFVFVIIYLLTKHNEYFDINNIKYNEQIIVDTGGNFQNSSKSTSTKTGNKKNNSLEFYNLNNNRLNNNLINNSKITNSLINNTIINGSKLNLPQIEQPEINEPLINNLTTKGTIRFTGEYTENKVTSNREPFVLLIDNTKNTQDQLIINTSGRSSINLTNNDSNIQIGDQILNRNKLEFLNRLYDRETQAQPPIIPPPSAPIIQPN